MLCFRIWKGFSSYSNQNGWYISLHSLTELKLTSSNHKKIRQRGFSVRMSNFFVADYSHCSCSYCSFWRRNRRLIPPVCIQWNVSLLGGPQTVSLNFLPTSSISTKCSHLFAGNSSCRRRLQIVQLGICISKGWTRDSTSSEKSSWSK